MPAQGDVMKAFHVALLVTFTASAMMAQSTLGTITGLVTDSTSAVVAGATITAKNIDTGAQATTASSSTGNYVIPSLQVGQYEISVSVAGFKSWRRGPIVLKSADTARIDISLEVG